MNLRTHKYVLLCTISTEIGINEFILFHSNPDKPFFL